MQGFEGSRTQNKYVSGNRRVSERSGNRQRVSRDGRFRIGVSEMRHRRVSEGRVLGGSRKTTEGGLSFLPGNYREGVMAHLLGQVLDGTTCSMEG